MAMSPTKRRIVDSARALPLSAAPCRKAMHLCPGGGIGRRTSFRCWRSQGRGGSSPLLGTIEATDGRRIGTTVSIQPRSVSPSERLEVHRHAGEDAAAERVVELGKGISIAAAVGAEACRISAGDERRIPIEDVADAE